jgi:hypothetical protein
MSVDVISTPGIALPNKLDLADDDALYLPEKYNLLL